MNKTIKDALIFLFAGILGGAISIGIYRMSEKDNKIEQENIPTGLTSYEINRITIPTFDFTEISKRINISVVHIKTKINPSNEYNNQNNPFYEFFGPRNFGPSLGSGSGVIISSDGYIVTNNHVIKNADEIEVILNDKRSFKANIVGHDKQTDLAVLKIETKELPFLKYGDSDKLKVGEWVIAGGNPFNLTSTVTAGIVSAKARSIGILGRGNSVESFIQTDAAVNPGNSGGALVNVEGELIGINTAIASRTGQYAGYSFAIPSNIVVKVVDDILKYGKVQRGFLGVSISEVTQEIAHKKNMDDIKGVYIAEVMPKGAANEAGIKSGDIIIKINDEKVNSVPELQEKISMNRPGDKILISLIRNGKNKKYTAVLKDLKGNTEIVTSKSNKLEDILGVKLKEIPKSTLDKLKIKNGVLVIEVKNGKFKAAGIHKNFIIQKIDKIDVYTVEDIYNLIDKSNNGVLIEGIEPDGSKGYYGFGIN
ncbi:MAG: Do family serine endopeptidase [Bacteroidota bacterium]|nr:Do family serine endopeptidase [Bacteroidota bacterium]